jgi:hypothetical protein
MRSLNRINPVLLLLLATGPVAAEPQLAKYLCITDYAAGIFFRPDGSLAAGQITAAPEKQKFFVTIAAEPGGAVLRQACFSKQQGEALKYEPPPQTGAEFDKRIDRQLEQMKKDWKTEEADPNSTSPLVLSPQQFIAACLSNFTANVADHWLSSFDGTTFLDGTGEVVFQFFRPNGALTFHLYEQTFASLKPLDYNDVVYRGRCELIQAPMP